MIAAMIAPASFLAGIAVALWAPLRHRPHPTPIAERSDAPASLQRADVPPDCKPTLPGTTERTTP